LNFEPLTTSNLFNPDTNTTTQKSSTPKLSPGGNITNLINNSLKFLGTGLKYPETQLSEPTQEKTTQQNFNLPANISPPRTRVNNITNSINSSLKFLGIDLKYEQPEIQYKSETTAEPESEPKSEPAATPAAEQKQPDSFISRLLKKSSDSQKSPGEETASEPSPIKRFFAGIMAKKNS